MHDLENMFFSFRYLKQSGESFALSQNCKIKTDVIGYASKYLADTVAGFSAEGTEMQITLALGIPEQIKAVVGDVYKEHSESYVVSVSSEENEVRLYAPTHRGLIYAVSTLKQLAQGGAVKDMLLFDYPDKDVRGYRVYTPGSAYIPTFKKMIDMLVYYKYNAMIIEIGGAMEYKRHPEINEKWVEFCKEISVSPDVSMKIQLHTYPWAKNSIHFDNGNGGYITQEEMKDIISYCREREIDVFPEVPSLSHSDYIVRTYPELNERKEDAYPDSYCPSNPKTYEILFDIIDEVVDVFKPKYLNIGHDEYYSSAKCKLCRKKRPVDIYVEDITKINDYLKTKNVKALMWCDKMFSNLVGRDEYGQPTPLGGAPNPKLDIPALYECRGRIPKDITLLHWYWNLSQKEDEQDIHDQGYQMLFSNFSAVMLDDYRGHAPIYNGGFASNWGSVEEKYMQRNRQNFDLVTTAWIFWNADYTDSDRGYLIDKTKSELYGKYKRSLGNNVIELDHTTDYYKRFYHFYDGIFIVDDDWLLGNHVVTYTDGTSTKLPVVYGYNIRSSGADCENEEQFRVSLNMDIIEAIGASCPYWKDGKIFYKTAYANPFPEKQIESIVFESKNGVQVELA